MFFELCRNVLRAFRSVLQRAPRPARHREALLVAGLLVGRRVLVDRLRGHRSIAHHSTRAGERQVHRKDKVRSGPLLSFRSKLNSKGTGLDVPDPFDEKRQGSRLNASNTTAKTMSEVDPTSMTTAAHSHTIPPKERSRRYNSLEMSTRLSSHQTITYSGNPISYNYVATLL